MLACCYQVSVDVAVLAVVVVASGVVWDYTADLNSTMTCCCLDPVVLSLAVAVTVLDWS